MSTVREPTTRLLERRGYVVLVAESGPAGLDIVAEQGAAIDLVLLDLSMTTMSGHEVLAALHRLRPGLKVHIITGYATHDEEVHGAAGILQKPFTVRHLLDKINEILAN